MDWKAVTDCSLKQVSYYNNDAGTELAPVFHGPSRARFANIAACLVDGSRFQYYMNRSSYWETDLITAARIFASKPETGVWNHLPAGYQQFLCVMREHLLQDIPLRRIYRSPQRLNFKLDLNSVDQMLKQIWISQEERNDSLAD